MEFIDGVIMIEEIYRFPMIFLIILCVIVGLSLWLILDLTRGVLHEEKSAGFKLILEFIIVANMFFIVYECYSDPFHLKQPTGEYRVCTTQDVNMTEFQDTYEIVDYKDGVYRIKSKENTNEN